MKFSKALILVLALALFAIPAMAQTSSSDKDTTCSLATLKGMYGFFGRGTIIAQIPGLPPPPLLTNGIGIATYDGKGNLSIQATQSLNGAISTGTGTGTYTVNPDCTYSDVLTISGGPIFHEAGTITGRGIFQQIHIIDIDPWFINVLTLKKTSSRACSLETLKGTYGALEQGTYVGPIGFNPPGTLVAIVATVTFDGEGNVSGTWTGNFSGTIPPWLPLTGTYTVSPDCAYSAEYSPLPGHVLHQSGIITGAGMFQEVHYIDTDAGAVTSGTIKK